MKNKQDQQQTERELAQDKIDADLIPCPFCGRSNHKSDKKCRGCGECLTCSI